MTDSLKSIFSFLTLLRLTIGIIIASLALTVTHMFFAGVFKIFFRDDLSIALYVLFSYASDSAYQNMFFTSIVCSILGALLSEIFRRRELIFHIVFWPLFLGVAEYILFTLLVEGATLSMVILTPAYLTKRAVFAVVYWCLAGRRAGL
jgi:hypothetical protein